MASGACACGGMDDPVVASADLPGFDAPQLGDTMDRTDRSTARRHRAVGRALRDGVLHELSLGSLSGGNCHADSVGDHGGRAGARPSRVRVASGYLADGSIFAAEMITLREYADSDLERLAALANNENVSRYLIYTFPHPYTRADAEWWIS